jgi:hypothetical protein
MFRISLVVIAIITVLYPWQAGCRAGCTDGSLSFCGISVGESLASVKKKCYPYVDALESDDQELVLHRAGERTVYYTQPIPPHLTEKLGLDILSSHPEPKPRLQGISVDDIFLVFKNGRLIYMCFTFYSSSAIGLIKEIKTKFGDCSQQTGTGVVSEGIGQAVKEAVGEVNPILFDVDKMLKDHFEGEARYISNGSTAIITDYGYVSKLDPILNETCGALIVFYDVAEVGKIQRILR